MTDDLRPVPLDDLLAHREWVRRLARAVTGNVHDADDVEQATWLAAVRTPPTDSVSLRGWLGTTLRRAAGKVRRSRSRSDAAMARLAETRPDTVAEDAAGVAARADAHRRVVDALMALDEPYRATLLLRFFEGLAVAEVATRTGVPLETARARLRRGLARLRADLDGRSGGRDAWAGVLLLPPDGKGPGGPGTAGGLAMAGTMKGIAALAIAAALAAGVWWFRGNAALTSTPPRGGEPGANAAPGGAASRAPEPTAPAPRASVPSPVAPEPAAAATAADVAVPPEPKTAPAPSAEERLAKTSVEFALDGVTFMRIFGEISGRAGVPIVAPRDLVESGGGRSSLHLAGTPAKEAILFCCRVAGLEAKFEASRVVLSRTGAAPADEASLVPVPAPSALPEVAVVVRVTGDDGATVPGAEVVAAVTGDALGRCDGSGRLELRLRAPLPRVVASAPGHVESEWTQLRDLGESPVRLRGRAARVRVTVVGEDSRPAASARVTWTAIRDVAAPVRVHSHWTNHEGRSEDPCVAPGDVSVEVLAAGHALAERTVTARAGDDLAVGVALEREAVVEGLITTSAGAPAPAVEVSIRGAPEAVRLSGTKTDGRYRAENLPAGRYTVVAKARDGTTASAEVVVAAGETRSADLTLAAPR